MAWTAPKTYVAGAVLTAAEKNTYERDNFIAVRAGGLELTGQAAGDDLYASSATQWAVGARQLRETFRGLTLRTHPDADKAANQVMLTKADEIVMHDGTRVADWDNLVADITASGAGGLDIGSEGASRWYEIHAIRKSSDGTKNLLLHRAKSFDADQTNLTSAGNVKLRDNAARTRLGQSFQLSATGAVPFIDVIAAKVGSPTGRFWLTIEADSAGAPSGTPLATSNKLDVSLLSTAATKYRVMFHAPATLTGATSYWIVMNGDFVIDASNHALWGCALSNTYANGAPATFNGSVWAGATNDFDFSVFAIRNDTALTMPTGYDQRALVGWVYNNGGSNFVFMRASDRDVEMSAAILSAGSATTLTLLDLSVAVPPVPVVMTSAQYRVDGTVGSQAFVVGNYEAPPGISGLIFYHVCNIASAGWTTAAPDLFVELQHQYYMHYGGGAASYWYPRAFRW